MHDMYKKSGSRVKKFYIFTIVLLSVFLIDRASKWLVITLLPQKGLYAISNIAGLFLERNQGIAYSIILPKKALIVVTGIILLALVFLIIRSYKRHELNISFALAMIVVGAFSNLLDRLRYGYVIDMIVLTGWPVFNLADLMITVGAVWMLWQVIKGKYS